MSRRAGRDERGSTTLELVVWAPGLLLLIGLLIVAGRVNSANAAVEQAAVDAARTASSARTAAAAGLAQAGAGRTLAAQGLQCTTTTVALDTSGFATPPGRSATVTATVTCPVRLSDLSIPGLPGTRTVSHTATSSLDTFRERS